MLLVELPVRLCSQGREEAVLAGGEGKPADIFAGDGFAVQRDAAAVIGQKLQHAFHQRRLARAVFAKQADDLARSDGQAHVLQRLLAAVSFAEIFHFQHQNNASQTFRISSGGMQRAGTLCR